MSVFHFKKFDVRNDKSAMKVNTDGVLLGASAPLQPSDRQILDIGTGTGTIALMLAQRLGREAGVLPSGTMITGIDIDVDAAAEAGENFLASPWNGNLKALHTPLSDYEPESRFDLIVSNPPYYDDSLTNPDARKATARHTGDGLSFRDILEFAEPRLNAGGRLCIILPADQEK
ncbi:MAG: tRNA1(Val) (adenine(37)-N6)-methyltransferase, partial [Candidatus Cryptobacteroides sp.]